MILSTAIELSSKKQAGVVDRPTDDEPLNVLVKKLPNIKIDTKERPFCIPYVAKCRLLLHSHLEHIDVQDKGLMQDLDAILKYAPLLINEMMSVLTQVWQFSKIAKHQKGRAGKRIPEPSAEMFETVMRLNQMLMQAIWVPVNPLLQLPHINHDNIRTFWGRKRRIVTIDEFALLRNDERRRMLKSLSDDQYQDIMVFCEAFPHITMKAEVEVPDDEDTKTITIGSLVNVSVQLVREGLLDHMKVSLDSVLAKAEDKNGPVLEEEEPEKEEEEEGKGPRFYEPETITATKPRSPKNSSKGSQPKKPQQKPKKKLSKAAAKQQKLERKKKEKKANMKREHKKEEEKVEEEADNEEENEINEENSSESELSSVDDEEKEWRELQKIVKKEKELKKGNTTDSHPAHAPYFPAPKQELWWLYIIDKKTDTIVLPPERVTGLKTTKETSLKLLAPERVGMYVYQVVLTSDTYLNLSIQQQLKFRVHPKREVSGKEQWADLEKEEEEEDAIEESVTESEYSDEDDD